jgi:hypothetical protein
MYQNNLRKVSYLTLKPLSISYERVLLSPSYKRNFNNILIRNNFSSIGNFNSIQFISNRNFSSLLNNSTHFNNNNGLKFKNNYCLSPINIKTNECHSKLEMNGHGCAIRYLSAQPQPQPQPQLESTDYFERDDDINTQNQENFMTEETNKNNNINNTKNDNYNNIDNNNNNNNIYNNCDNENNNENRNNNNDKRNNGNNYNEEAEDELNILLSSKDNFFVREWKEIKSFLWHLVFGSQVLIHEAQQALELKQKRIDNVPLTRRESLLIRRSFHDTLCVIPFFVLLAIEPYYLFLLSSIFPSMVPSVYVTPHILKKNLEKNKKHRKRIAKSAAKLAPWVSFNVQALKDEKNLYHLSKNEFKQLDIDSLSWWHLKSCAGYLGLYGMLPKTVLKIRMDEYFDYIKSDDEFINEEGIDTLTLEELRLANEQRGFNSLGLSKKELANNLQHWINFFTSEENKEIPRMVLILSHIYSDNIKFQAEARQRKAYRKRKRQELFKKLTFSSFYSSSE